MSISSIEWLGRRGYPGVTWNYPVTGCTPIPGEFSGCGNCYAHTFAERWRGVPGHAYEAGFDVTLRPDRAFLPFGWKKPQDVFVCSMGDPFHVDVPLAMLGQMFATMAFTPQHTYMLLTKRPERMRRFMRGAGEGQYLGKALSLDAWIGRGEVVTETVGGHTVAQPWPAPNVWLGTSISSNADAFRADMLRETAAAVRWISAEPLLAPLDRVDFTGMDWVVVGGESGPGARPMDLGWARDVVARARAGGAAVFVKQLGTVWSRTASDGLHRGNPKGSDAARFPLDLQVREYPRALVVPA